MTAHMTYQSAAKRKQDLKNEGFCQHSVDVSIILITVFLGSKEKIRLSKPFPSCLKPHYESYFLL